MTDKNNPRNEQQNHAKAIKEADEFVRRRCDERDKPTLDPLDEIFVERFHPSTYRKIERKIKEFKEGKRPRKRIDITMDFFREDSSRDLSNSWVLFCQKLGFSYSTFLNAFHKVQKGREA